MYKVIKEPGLMSSVILENTDTKSNITIGQISIKLFNILEKAGYSMEGTQRERWDLEVNKETAEELAKLAMPIKKPIRTKKEKTKEENKKIDAMDVLLGLAQYN